MKDQALQSLGPLGEGGTYFGVTLARRGYSDKEERVAVVGYGQEKEGGRGGCGSPRASLEDTDRRPETGDRIGGGALGDLSYQ